MNLDSNQAYEILENGSKINPTGKWVNHSKRVGEAASRIAYKMGLDSDKARAMGYIHDIGKIYGEPYSAHAVKGYEYLKSMEISDEYANICLTHSYLNNDIDCTAGGYPDKNSYKYQFRKDFIENYQYNEYDKIIECCDLFCTDEFLTMEERLLEIMLRRGAHENTVYHITYALKLKEELEEKMHCKLYSLFPEIKEKLF